MLDLSDKLFAINKQGVLERYYGGTRKLRFHMALLLSAIARLKSANILSA